MKIDLAALDARCARVLLPSAHAREVEAMLLEVPRLIARVRELEAAQAWRPIETAPRDRTAVWLLCDGRRYIGYYEPAAPPIWPEGKWYLKATVRPRPTESLPEEILGCYAHDAAPTHWLPLPAPPDKEKGETE